MFTLDDCINIIPYPSVLFSYTTLFTLHQSVSNHILLFLHFQYQALEYRNTLSQFILDFNTKAFYGIEVSEWVFRVVAH